MKALAAIAAVVFALLIAQGCARQSDTQAPKAKPAEHSHGAGPHGGSIAEWGRGKYHIEFTVDHDKQEATVFVLGQDAKTPEPVACEKVLLSIREPRFQVDLAPQPLDGESGGKASRFVGRHEDLGKVQEFAGTITAVVAGTPYAGDFQEQP